MVEMTDIEVAGRRSNKRGMATRDNMLDAALRSLASGEPGAVSGNRIAKEIGATWGTVKYQFGDIDGLWAAVLRYTAERRGDLPASAPITASLRDRVTAIVDNLYEGLSGTDSRAIETLRAAMPRDRNEFERLFPLTAAEFESWRQEWLDTCRRAFVGLDVDQERLAEVAAFIPGAMRGMASEKQLGTYTDLDLARRGLTNAIVNYLQS